MNDESPSLTECPPTQPASATETESEPPAGPKLASCNPSSSLLTLAVAADPAALALDADHVYFGDNDGVYAVSKNGGEATLLATTSTFPIAIHTDADQVYWSAQGIFRSIAGGPVETLVDRPTAGFVLGPTSLYFADWATQKTSIVRTDRQGAGETTVYQAGWQQWFALGLQGEELYPIQVSTASEDELAVIDTQTLERRVLGEHWLTHGFALDDEYLYLADHMDYQPSANPVKSELKRVARAGGELEVLASLETYAVALARAGDYLYVAEHTLDGTNYHGQLVRRGLGGGDPCQLGSFDGYAASIAVDELHVYLTASVTFGDGAVYRAER